MFLRSKRSRLIVASAFLSLMVFTLASCASTAQGETPSTEAVRYPPVEEREPVWVPVWAEEFDVDGLPNPAKWSFDTSGNTYGWGNDEEQYYSDSRPENCRVEDGKLIITALKEDMGGKEYSSARIHTRLKGDWKYGKISVRAKLPCGAGIWPAIWFMPTYSVYGGWPESGEIDLMEYFGVEPDHIQHNVHTGKRYHRLPEGGRGHKIPVGDAREAFHDYTLQWFEDRLEFWFDDTLTWTLPRQEEVDPGLWPFDQEFYLILNCAVNEGWGGDPTPIDDSIFPQEFIVDYVRVWQDDDGKPKTITVSESPGGRVVLDPPGGSYRVGDRVRIGALPAPGHVSRGWAGDIRSDSSALEIVMAHSISISPVFVPEDELIVNGDFTQGMARWNSWIDSSAAAADLVVDHRGLNAHVIKAGEAWQVQINQAIALKEGKTYRLSFRALASKKRSLRVALVQNYAPYGSIASASAALDSEVQQFSFDLANTGGDDPAARLEFDFGETTGDLTISNVSLRELE